MPPKKGTSTPNKPPDNPSWTLDEDSDELQEMMDSTEDKEEINSKMDGLKGEIIRIEKLPNREDTCK
jgi:hypothetical protein